MARPRHGPLLSFDETFKRHPDAGAALCFGGEARACALGNVIIHVPQSTVSTQGEDSAKVVHILLLGSEKHHGVFGASGTSVKLVVSMLWHLTLEDNFGGVIVFEREVLAVDFAGHLGPTYLSIWHVRMGAIAVASRWTWIALFLAWRLKATTVR